MLSPIMLKALDPKICKVALSSLLKSLSQKQSVYDPNNHGGVNLSLITTSGSKDKLRLGKFPNKKRYEGTRFNAEEKTRRSLRQYKRLGSMTSRTGRNPDKGKWGGGIFYHFGKHSFALAPSGLPEVWDEILNLVIVQLHLIDYDIIGYYKHNIPSDGNLPFNSDWMLKQARKVIKDVLRNHSDVIQTAA